MDKPWFIYILECRTGELYVGVTNDVEERIVRHNSGTACRYTKFRRPVRLIYEEMCDSYKAARKRETQVKKYSRVKKLSLKDLSPR